MVWGTLSRMVPTWRAPGYAARGRRFGAAECGVVGALGFVVPAVPFWQVAAEEVSTPVQDQIEAKLSDGFLIPQTTIWHFDGDKPYVGGERVVCGWVNFQSAQQTYVGYHQFYAIVSDNTVTLTQIDDPVSDTSGELAAKLKSLCGMFKRPG